MVPTKAPQVTFFSFAKFKTVVVPVLIAAVEMTDYVLNGGRVNEIMKWAQFLVIYDGIFIVLCSFMFRYVFEE